MCRMEGVCITTLINMGRVVVATRAFDVGEVVLREQPVLVWAGSGPIEFNHRSKFLSFLKSFLAAGTREQDVILDMYHPDLESLPELGILASSLARQLGPGAPLSKEKIHKLIAISSTNSHAYFGTDLSGHYR